METRIEQWRSPSLGRDMSIAVYGTSGTPVIALPTRGAGPRQWESHGMVEAISKQLNEGYNQLFCIESVDKESLLNKDLAPSRRITRQQQFESYVVEEVVPYVREQNHFSYLIVAGTDLGGYHALNIALKHPDEFDKVIGLSGVYDIKEFLDDYYDDDVYYNNPVDYIPNLADRTLLQRIKEIDFRLVSYTSDPRNALANRMSHVLRMKFIEHDLDIWDLSSDEEWSLWQRMLQTHII